MRTSIRIALAIVFVLSLSSYASLQTQQSGTKLVTIRTLIDGSDVSLPYAAKARLLPEGAQFDARLVTPQDRGSVTILQQPSAQNNFTLSILLDDDFAVGAAWYQVELRLK